MRGLGKYIRLSDQDDDCRPGEKTESNSVANQRLLLDQFIANDPELAGCRALEFLDDGHTGTNFDRPGVQALFAAVRHREIDCIIVKDLSRFGRDSLEVGEYLERVFPLLQVRFIAVNDNQFEKSRILTRVDRVAEKADQFSAFFCCHICAVCPFQGIFL